ncbi:hypothetical protein CF319_g8735 [Tilletia indica]|nr:hypothetical protein CF319_g8735 [Tilletia indica]
MSAAVLQQYSPDLFQSLPSVGKASTKFKTVGGLEQIHDALFAVVQKHPVTSNRLGIQLLHRHSDLDDDEFLLEFRGTTVPVKKTEVSDDTYGRIYPVIWGIDPASNSFAPLEFSILEDGNSGIPQLDQELAADIAKVFLTFGLEKILGLALIEEHGTKGVETTHHRANIVRPAGLFAKMPSAVEVLWSLPSVDQRIRSFKDCKLDCDLGNEWEGHEQIHSTVKNSKPR